MSEAEYDERTCVTAGELRARGIDVPKEIPDVGWVPRESIRGSFKAGGVEGDTLHGVTTIEFTEPFRWIDARVMIR